MAGGTVDRIKEKLSIIDVVSPYVKIARAGKYWKGLSPFNKEKTPSFYVNPERGSYYCFSSSQGGDMFTFIEKMEGVDFKGALKILAEKAGVELVYEGGAKQDKGRAERLREAMSRAEQFFVQALTLESAARAYARGRGLTEESLGSWGIGFAPDAWRGLLDHLAGLGFTTEEMLAAGLVKEAEGKPGTYYDRFRNRLMFPIRDTVGRTVAFTGRTLSSEEQAKYLNSPETELFKKSNVLFAMDRAKDAIRTRGFAILMEGQMDVLHAHQAGFRNAVGLSGTALSPEHLALMKRYAENLMLALDADRAGLAATQKHAIAALASGMRVKAIRLPEGKDPADLISEDAKDFAARAADAPTVVEFFLAVISEQERDQHKLVLAVERIVLPLVAATKSPIEREHFVGVVARAIGSTPEAVRAAVPKSAPGAVQAGRPVVRASIAGTAPELIIRAVAQNYPDTPLAARVKSEYARITGTPMPEEASPEPVLFETGILYGEAPDEHAADDAIRLFEKAMLQTAYAAALQELRQAGLSGNTDAIRKAEERCVELAKAIALAP